MQFSATGSPQGGSFSYVAGCLNGSCPGPEPLIAFSTGVTAQTNPNAAVLSNPDNPCANQVPCPGLLSGITATYTLPDPILILNGSAQFNVATFGLSCYDTTTQQQWGTAPDSCFTTTITVNGVPVTYSGYTSNPPLLPAGNYCNAFLAQFALQGSASLTDGTLWQYSPYIRQVTQITGHDGSPVTAGQTVARDLAVIPTVGVLVDINGLGNGLSANDTGGRIQGYRFDVYMGVGAGACTGTPANSNIMAVSGCNPGNSACPASTTVGQ
jgi:3D (Asp-Asp-Asp) domain-containing protein